MHPYLLIFGKTIPTYGLMAALGFGLSISYVLLMAPKRDLDRENAGYIFCMGGIGALIGAKLLYLVISLPKLVGDLHLLTSDTRLFAARYLLGGMVFYGGLMGALIGAYMTAGSYRVSFTDYCRVLVPAEAVMAGIGRIGCFMAGCCYGVETDLPIGVEFHLSEIAPHGVSLMPVQLMEAAFDLGLAAALTVMARDPGRSKKLLPVFILSYGTMRFFLEFLRGDAARGSIGPLSTSQIISLAAIAGTIIIAGRAGQRRKIDEEKR